LSSSPLQAIIEPMTTVVTVNMLSNPAYVAIPDPAPAAAPQTLSGNAHEIDPVGNSLTLDLSSPSIYVLISGSNVTSWTIPNGQHNQTVTIVWAQGGMGHFTLAGTPANVRLAGGSFVLTGDTSKVDVLTLQWNTILNQWVEQSRAMNQ